MCAHAHINLTACTISMSSENLAAVAGNIVIFLDLNFNVWPLKFNPYSIVFTASCSKWHNKSCCLRQHESYHSCVKHKTYQHIVMSNDSSLDALSWFKIICSSFRVFRQKILHTIPVSWGGQKFMTTFRLDKIEKCLPQNRSS